MRVSYLLVSTCSDDLYRNDSEKARSQCIRVINAFPPLNRAEPSIFKGNTTRSKKRLPNSDFGYMYCICLIV